MSRKSKKPVEATPENSCSLDPMLTPLVVSCIDILLFSINKIINLTSTDGLICCFRPVSNLLYISKLTEKAVFSQT